MSSGFKDASTDLFGLIALFVSGLVWMKVARALLTHIHSEALMWKILFNAFYWAPLAYGLGLAAYLWNIYRKSRTFGLTKFALITSLPTVGIWLACRLPDMLFRVRDLSFGVNLLIFLLVLLMPAIFATIIILSARKIFLTLHSSGTGRYAFFQKCGVTKARKNTGAVS